MQSTTSVHMRADPPTIYDLAAAVERWPEFLPHYRYVRVLRQDGPHRRTVEMAARRDLIPVRWLAEQELFPDEHRITFKHVGGVTRGMDVAWTLTPAPNGDGTLVQIWHDFRAPWPLVPDALVHLVIGEFFIANIAGKTLRRVRDLAEAQHRAAQAAAPPSV